MAAKMAFIFDDVTGPQQCRNPYSIPHLIKHNTRFVLRMAKPFQNIVTQLGRSVNPLLPR